MSGQRQKNRPEQGVLAFPTESRSEALKADGKGTETLVAKRRPESLAETERLMEEVCEWSENQGGALPPRPSPDSKSGFENGRAEPEASASPRWLPIPQLTCVAGSATSGSDKRRRCCNALNRGYAADSGLWCGSNGNREGRDSKNFENGV